MIEKTYIEREMTLTAIKYAELGEEYSVVEQLPAADVRPVVSARWEEKAKDGVWWYACSVCGEHIPKGRWGQEWHSNFCPNCGAEMMKGEA